MTPVNTRAVLLFLEKIKNIAEVETKPPSAMKSKGAESKHKMESIYSCMPKKSKQVGFSHKHCVLCKKHDRPHKLHNTRDCRKYNSNGTPIKLNGGTGSTQRNGHTDKHHSKTRELKGANYAQIIYKEVKKAYRKQSHKHKKHCANDSESDSNSDYSS